MTQDILVTRFGHVVQAELNKPPANFFDEPLLSHLADVLEEMAEDAQCRAVVLCAAGKHFCAGADFSSRSNGRSDGSSAGDETAGRIYRQAVRIFAANVPIVAAVQGSAVGGGLGLACA